MKLTNNLLCHILHEMFPPLMVLYFFVGLKKCLSIVSLLDMSFYHISVFQILVFSKYLKPTIILDDLRWSINNGSIAFPFFQHGSFAKLNCFISFWMSTHVHIGIKGCIVDLDTTKNYNALVLHLNVPKHALSQSCYLDYLFS